MARVGLSSNRKFLRLARALTSTPLARGVLEVLWEPCFEAGDPYVGTSDDIEALCEWAGARGALTQALLDAGAPKGAGFIEPYAGDVRDAGVTHYQIHDFFHHCPEYAKARRERERELTTPKICALCGETFYSRVPHAQFCRDRCRVAAHRQKTAVTHGNAPLRSETFCNGTPTPTPTPSTRTRTLAAYVDGAEPNSAPASDVPGLECEEDAVARPHQRPQKRRAVDPPPDDSPSALTFPVVGQGGPVWLLREAQIAAWQALYPNIDILAEARHALAWIDANPTKRKTAGGMLKFLVSWLNRAVDAPRSRGPTMITGSLKTAGNRDAIAEFLRRRGHVMD